MSSSTRTQWCASLDYGEPPPRETQPPLPSAICSASVLDACCGSRMFWFDRKDDRAVFVDKRRESHTLRDKSSRGGSRTLTINPDIVADFTALPFSDNKFSVVIFDPPHLIRAGKKGWQAKKYGKLEGDWRNELRQGFSECFRVLKPEGTLIFKWNEVQITVDRILALTPHKPLYGHKTGKQAKTHWIAFLKPNVRVSASGGEKEKI